MNLWTVLRNEAAFGVKYSRGLKSTSWRRSIQTMSGEAVKWKSQSIRETFISYFVNERDHRFVKSSSVIPQNDSTLLLVNSGMNQFKPLFLGQSASAVHTEAFAGLSRAVNSQKCIRVGGKHNDLEDVGRDLKHHSFFEMLGSWAFDGAYYNKEACAWAWELLTERFGLDKDRLLVTYFEGNPSLGLEADVETREVWRAIGVKKEAILPLGSSDNFWEMGATGPCGPCTEIHYILDPTLASRQSMDSNALLENCLEVWNLVFMMFNRISPHELQPLPAVHVDTGMGFERLVSILQETSSNYDTDLFAPLFECIQKRAKLKPYTGSLHDPLDIAYRLIADHSRMFSVAIADGLKPEKQGAGHVLRKVIRSSSWETVSRLGLKPGAGAKLLAHNLPLVVSNILGDAYPEIREGLPLIKEVVNLEVQRFDQIVVKTRRRFKERAQSLLLKGQQTMSGSEAYEIFNITGSPKELLQSLGQEYGLRVDIEEFDRIHLTYNQKSAEIGGKFTPRSSTIGTKMDARLLEHQRVGDV